MRNSWLLLVALLAAAGAAPRQQEEPQAVSPAFSVGISAAQDVVRSGSAVTVRSVVTNISNQKIWVVSLGEDVECHVWDSRGFPVRRANPRVERARLQLQVDKHGEHVVVPYIMARGVWFAVQPGQTVEDDLVISEFYELTRPGKYTIQALRPDPESHAVVKSNTITLTVIP